MKSPTPNEQVLSSTDRARLQLIEQALHLLVTTALISALWSVLPFIPLLAFVIAQIIIAIFRIIVQSGQKMDDDTDRGIVIGAVLQGTLWGTFAVVLYRMSLDTVLPVHLVSIAIVLVNFAAMIGAAQRSSPILGFALPTLGLPLIFVLTMGDIRGSAILVIALTSVAVLARLANKQDLTLSAIRMVMRQNSSLLNNLASARDHALQNQKEAEQANKNLKVLMKEQKQAEAKIQASERELKGILQDLQDTYFRVNTDDIIERVSASVFYLTGYREDELTGKDWGQIFFDQSASGDFTYELDRSLGHLLNHEVCLRHQDGAQVWASVHAHYYYHNGVIAGFEGTARDITEKRRAEEAVVAQKERLRVTLESIGDGVLTTDNNGLLEYMNPKAENMTGWKTHAAEGNPLTEILNLRNENNNLPVELPIADWVDGGEIVELPEPAILLHKNGNHLSSIELTASSIKDPIGTSTGAVLVFRDVTKLRSLTKRLQHQATHDALTGLPNRVEFETCLQQAIHTAHVSNKEHAICYIDLDKFKIVNDTCGHHAGDQLLQQVTRLMQGMLRDSDTLSRLGGDEFGVLLPNCPLHKAEEIAEKLRAAVEEYRYVWEGETFRIGLSIGLVTVNRETSSLTDLLKAADSACYVAKEHGRNCVHVYKSDDSEVGKHRGNMQWAKRIQYALDNDKFVLHFQPIISVNQKSTTTGLHGEILLRMQEIDNEDRTSLVSPKIFLPTAERYHLMQQIDRWVIRNTLRQILENERSGIKLGICAINLSRQSMEDTALLDFIIEEIKASQLPPGKLCFEITESAVISNLDYARELINKLKELGCSFALDDFGSGLSSFDYLKDLPVDYIKLDGTLIRDVAINKVSQAMVHASNYVVHAMEMKSIAEYVENKDILERLRHIDIDYVQGYAIAKPAPFTTEYLRRLI